MEVLLPHISRWFLDKHEHFTAFAQADSRIEGWFKAELLVLFNLKWTPIFGQGV